MSHIKHCSTRLMVHLVELHKPMVCHTSKGELSLSTLAWHLEASAIHQGVSS